MKCTGVGRKKHLARTVRSTCPNTVGREFQEHVSKIFAEWPLQCKPPKKEGKKDKNMREGTGTLCWEGKAKRKTAKSRKRRAKRRAPILCACIQIRRKHFSVACPRLALRPLSICVLIVLAVSCERLANKSAHAGGAHHFHKECVERWFLEGQRNKTRRCPICRSDPLATPPPAPGPPKVAEVDEESATRTGAQGLEFREVCL